MLRGLRLQPLTYEGNNKILLTSILKGKGLILQIVPTKGEGQSKVDNAEVNDLLKEF